MGGLRAGLQRSSGQILSARYHSNLARTLSQLHSHGGEREGGAITPLSKPHDVSSVEAEMNPLVFEVLYMFVSVLVFIHSGLLLFVFLSDRPFLTALVTSGHLRLTTSVNIEVRPLSQAHKSDVWTFNRF